METNWVLKQVAIDAIEDTFGGPACIYRNLVTNNKYWEPKFAAREGVKKKTVERIALRFIRILRDVNDHNFSGDGLDHKKAVKYYKKFKISEIDDDVSSLIEQVEAKAKATPAVTDAGAETPVVALAVDNPPPSPGAPRVGGAAG